MGEQNKHMDLTVGAVVEGKVKSLSKFGAFITLPDGSTGMVHISEIAHAYVNDIRDHLTEGQDVKVMIISRENGKTNLSLDIFTRIVEVLQISADWLIMADIPQTMEYSSAELSRLLADCSVSESKAILKMAENLKEILRSQK